MRASILGLGVVAPGAAGCGALVAALGGPPPQEPRVSSIGDEGEGRARRAPRLERMVLAAAKEALGGQDPEGLALVFGTGYGGLTATADFLEGMAARGPAFGSPTSFHQSVHHSPAGTLSIALGIRGSCFTLSARELSGESALKVGLDLIASGRAGRVLVVAADEVVPSLLAGYRAFGSALVAGEGAAAVLLGAGGQGPGIALCALSGHPGPGLRFAASSESLEPLLRRSAAAAGPEPVVSTAAADPAFEAAERLAIAAAVPGARLLCETDRFGVNPSGGLLRVVTAALRLRAAPGRGCIVHGAALGGGQAVTVVRHDAS
ncbi:MAG: beta-ketoacyl synthase chain length factor [Myxococcaceae bacterium]